KPICFNCHPFYIDAVCGVDTVIFSGRLWLMKIFRDESGWRSFWTRFVVKISIVAISVLTAAVAFLVLKRPELPQLHHATQMPELTGSSDVNRAPRVGRPLARGWRPGDTSHPALRYAFYST